ncbi:YidC/Oxa1 family membrane protein insertase [Streptomyces sp. 1114.5]|uniref:membrane protein insertase YidC n=1 Tax=unclassified Streptomyces TaxID=2593676 RepID=UPI000BCAA06B|nr:MULTISPECIES: membrane protein insertase YidC [unclassified Streptomyces]RKT16756.1 YidC/Oxa1 family membrane protein insertase [Streptomyces sp. 1114.5]SOB82927.1 YidC/Oxa1 family membrane protein insertase [Streptomyces sp. 1331.2]
MTFGFLSPLYTAVSWIIVQFHSLYSHVFDPDGGWAWGLAIASMVVVIRICLIPLFVKQIKATRAMQAIQPKMKAIQERYKNDRQRQSEEMMKLYKEAGTNPFSSCLPIIVQAPFFTALYGVLAKVAKGQDIGVIHGDLLVSAGKAHIFGAPLSATFLGSDETNVKIVTAVMIILMSLSQFVTQRQLMTKNVDLTVKTPFMQQQKMLMYVFPVMFAVMGINFPVGVLVYWLTTNVWSMGQQLIVIHNNPTPGSKAFQERQARLKKAGRLRPDGTEIKGALWGMLPPSKDALSAATAASAAVEESVQARRQQPRRQSKSQRQHGVAGQPTADLSKDASAEEPADAAPADSGTKPAAAKQAAAKPAGTKQGTRQQPKRGGQRPKKKS